MFQLLVHPCSAFSGGRRVAVRYTLQKLYSSEGLPRKSDAWIILRGLPSWTGSQTWQDRHQRDRSLAFKVAGAEYVILVGMLSQ
jgi:hypothetical protein